MLRVSLIVTPRTLCEETRSKGRPLTHKGPRSGRVLSEQITSSLHFFGLRFILLRDDHCAMASRSFWRDDVPPDGMTSDIVRSSTYFQWLDSNGVSIARSLIIRRNRMGPSLVPCGKTCSEILTSCNVLLRSIYWGVKLRSICDLILGTRRISSAKCYNFLPHL